mgnify:CR=1 FL=1
MKVLVTDKADAKAARSHPSGRTRGGRARRRQGADLVTALDGAQALLVRGGTKVTGDVLRATTTLKVVVRAGTGLDNVDAGAAGEKGIAVYNTPNANSVSVAELVFGLLLALERHLVDAVGELRQGSGKRRASPAARSRDGGSASWGSVASDARSPCAPEPSRWRCGPTTPC